jgi:hypothetical protein
MRIACVHVLPLEYYPPATTLLDILSRQEGLEVRAWSSVNARNHKEWQSPLVHVERPRQSAVSAPLASRMIGYLNWHFRTASRIARWKPDVLVSIEPHSALATWLYYNAFGGRARLFTHHHEYYSSADFDASGMRLLRATRRLERNDLFTRAEWISETNAHRLALLRQWNPGVTDRKAKVLPNYPPGEWVARARSSHRSRDTGRTRFLYLGSASLEDTFIGEIASWIAARPESATLHVTGNNIAAGVWQRLRSLGATNITLDEAGWEYETIPERLATFDVGLILYRGNTQNFIYNVPNKTIEYLAGGLEVWYPPEMKAMSEFHAHHPKLGMREMNFLDLPARIPDTLDNSATEEFPFTAEAATQPLISAIRRAD